jgi:hypothetical protein
MQSPEDRAREKIDALLEQCGWILQNRSTIIAAEIVEDLEAALQQFAAIAADLKR